MYLILGVVLTLAGAAMLAFGVFNSAFGLGNTLIEAGTTAFTGGLILMALSAVLKQMREVPDGAMAHHPEAHLLSAEDLAEPEVPAIRKAAPAAPAAPRIPFPPKREARPRMAAPVLSPEPRFDTASSLDATDEPMDRPPPAFMRNEPEQRVIPERDDAPLSPPAPRFGASRDDKDELSEGLLATAFSRLDVSVRPAAPAEENPAKQNEMFQSLWPPESRKASEVEPAETESAEPEAPPEQPEEQPYAVSILKSGVVDGMAYTLYSDGSIEAEMPQGTMRFASITELRAYLERSSS